MFFGAGHIVVEVLPEGAHIDIEDGRLDGRIMFSGNKGLFGRVHAADRRAVVAVAGMVAGTDALDPGDFLRMFSITRTGNRA